MLFYSFLTLNYDKIDQFGLPKITLDAEFKENEMLMKEDWKNQAAEMQDFDDLNDIEDPDFDELVNEIENL